MATWPGLAPFLEMAYNVGNNFGACKGEIECIMEIGGRLDAGINLETAITNVLALQPDCAEYVHGIGVITQKLKACGVSYADIHAFATRVGCQIRKFGGEFAHELATFKHAAAKSGLNGLKYMIIAQITPPTSTEKGH